MADVGRKRPTATITEGVFIDGFVGYSIFVEKVNDRTNEIRGVKIYQLNSGARPTTILADWGVIHNSPDGRVTSLELHDGEIHEVPPNDAERTYRRLMFKTHVINIRNVGGDLERRDREARGDREMSLGMMQGHIRQINQDLRVAEARRDQVLHDAGFKDYRVLCQRGRPPPPLSAGSGPGSGTPSAPSPPSGSARAPRPRRSFPPRFVSPVTADIIQMRQLEVDALDRRAQSLEVEIQKKFSIPTACIVFVLVGAPLGIRARKSGIAVAFLSILFFVFYYLCLAGGEELADRQLLSPWIAMWAPNLVMGAIGLVLTLQAAEIIQRPRRRPRPRKAVPA